MGCFNTTCAISHAPIIPGCKVRLFFLVSNRFYYDEPERNILSLGCQCYPHDDFTVLGGVPIEATYADYGRYDFDYKNIFVRHILNELKECYSKNVSEPNKEYNSSRDFMDINVENLDWPLIFDMIHTGRLYIRGYRGKKLGVAVMAVHESIYQMMSTKSNGFSKYLKTQSDFLQENIAQRNDLLLQLKPFIEQKKMSEDLIPLPRDDFNFDHSYDRNQNPYYKIKELIEKYHKVLDTEDEFELKIISDEQIIKKIYEAGYFNISMKVENIMYRPIMTSGQVYELFESSLFHYQIAEALSNIKIPNHDDYDDEDYINAPQAVNIVQKVKLSDIYNKCKTYSNSKKGNEMLGQAEDFFAGYAEGTRVTISKKDMKNKKDKKFIDLFQNKDIDIEVYID